MWKGEGREELKDKLQDGCASVVGCALSCCVCTGSHKRAAHVFTEL